LTRWSELSVTIKALAITEDLDRPTTAMFVGLHRAGVDIRVMCPSTAGGRQTLVAAGVPVLEFLLRKRIDRQGIRALRDELENGRYDILHAFSNKALQNGLIAARGLPIKIIAYRGIVGNVSFLSPISWKRFLNPRIDRIVCVADAVRDYFLAMQPAFLRVPAERLVRIYKGHDLDWYDAEPADLGLLGVPPDAFVIGCVANYRPRKGIEYLVDAFASLPDEYNAYLLLIGEMSATKLDRHIASSGAAARILRPGYRGDAPALTAACDVFVLPSTRREGLARSLIEAMAYGVPPVVTACGGSPELVEHGVSGIVVPVRDAVALREAISALYMKPALRERYGAAARERIRTGFRIEDTIDQTVALYRELTAPGQ
jgi:glycosyltransferase involved in cell wall biosynthesis